MLASTDPITGLYNRKGFADRAADCAPRPAARGDNLVIVSFQIHRFKTVNDQHGYETGDRLLKCIADGARPTSLAPMRCIARLSGDEFAVALALDPDELAPRRASRRSGASRGHPPVHVRGADHPGRRLCRNCLRARRRRPAFPTCCAAPTSRWTMRASGRVARPVWFDAGMERALIAQGEIEQGIRYGLEHGQFVPLFRAAGGSRDRRDRRLRGAGAVEPPAVGHHRPRRLHPGRRGDRPDRAPVRASHRRSACAKPRRGTRRSRSRSTSRRSS